MAELSAPEGQGQVCPRGMWSKCPWHVCPARYQTQAFLTIPGGHSLGFLLCLNSQCQNMATVPSTLAENFISGLRPKHGRTDRTRSTPVRAGGPEARPRGAWSQGQRSSWEFPVCASVRGDNQGQPSRAIPGGAVGRLLTGALSRFSRARGRGARPGGVPATSQASRLEGKAPSQAQVQNEPFPSLFSWDTLASSGKLLTIP